MDQATHRTNIEQALKACLHNSLSAPDSNDSLLSDQDIGDLFSLAIDQKDLRCVPSLLSRGFDPNIIDSTGRTPLTKAAEFGSAADIVDLVNSGAIVDMESIHGISPIGYASRAGRQENVIRLLESGASVNAEAPNRQTSLHLAAIGNAAGVIPILVAHGAYVNCSDASGNTPLHLAIHNGPSVQHNPTVNRLLECGADPDLPNKNFESPLKCVSKYGETELYRFKALVKSMKSPTLELP